MSLFAAAVEVAQAPGGGGGSPREGIKSVFLGVVVILGLIMLLNYKKLQTILSLLAVIVVGATVVYAPPSMFENLGDAGSGVLSWIARQF